MDKSLVVRKDADKSALTRIGKLPPNLQLTPLTPARQAVMDRIRTENKFIGLYKMRNTLVSRLCLGGKVRTIGFFPFSHETKQVELAVRLTDVATLYFWKFRIRSKTEEPTEDHLNLGLASAKHDLENEEELSQHVVDLRYELENQGLLPSNEEIKKWKEGKLLSRSENLKRTAQIHTMVTALFKQNEEIKLALSGINHNISVIAEALDKLIRNK